MDDYIYVRIRNKDPVDDILSMLLTPNDFLECLKFATACGTYPELVEALFLKGVNPNSKTQEGYPIFQQCFLNNRTPKKSLEILKLYLKYRVDPNMPVHYNCFNKLMLLRPIVYLAIIYQGARCLKGEILLKAGVNPITKAEMNGRDPNPWYIDCFWSLFGPCLLAVRLTRRALNELVHKDVIGIICDYIWATRLDEKWGQQKK